MKQQRQFWREQYSFEWLFPLVIIGIIEAVVVLAGLVMWRDVGQSTLLEYVWFSQPWFEHFAALMIPWGLWRVYATHPVFSQPYLEWMQRNPWQAGKKLPAGPVHLRLRDSLPIGLVVAWLGWRGGIVAGVFALLAFGLACAIILGIAFTAIGMRRSCYQLAILVNGMLVTTLLSKGLTLMVAMVLMVLMQRLINTSLVRTRQLASSPFQGNSGRTKSDFYSVGWPHADLSPRSILPQRPDLWGGSGAVVGLFALTATTFLGVAGGHHWIDQPSPFLTADVILLAHVGLAFVIGLIRTLIWGCRIAPGGGRRATRKVFVWKLDSVLLAPAVGLLISIGLAYTALIIPHAWVVTIPLSSGLALLCNGLIGPSYDQFRATHAGRMSLYFTPSSQDLTK